MASEFSTFRGSASGKITEGRIAAQDLKPSEVLLHNLYSGVCGTDEHYRGLEIVLGHEGVSIVKQVGKDVRNVKIGDRVGVGYVRGGCGYCSQCLLGYHFFCENEPINYGSQGHDIGTWASHAVVPSTRLVKIPESIPSQYAGPLMCAGQTVWLPLARTDVRSWHTVGVIGIGGLGHLAIQFASKMGCRVVAFSGTDSKREEAFQLGATDFFTSTELKNGNVPKHFVNHLLVTTSQLPDWKLYDSILANRAHIFPLTISPSDIAISSLTLVTREITIHGLCSSTLTQVNDMLGFVARHKIFPMIEEFPMTQEGVEEALSKLEAGSLRYRAVLKILHSEE